MSTLQLSVDSHVKSMNKDLERMEEIASDTMQTLAGAANKEQLKELDGIFKGLACEMARYQEAVRLSKELKRDAQRGDELSRNEAIEKLVQQLEQKHFAQDKAKDAHKTFDAYISFVEKNRERESSIGEGIEIDDELAVMGGQAGGSVDTQTDPYTQTLLQKDRESGKFPVKMPCGHLYNWSSVTSKRQNKWCLEKCAVAGCPSQAWPSDRSGLKECRNTKSAIERRDKGLSQANRDEPESLDVEDL
mmetsp:Transcript_38113/g.74480  ORF Transcript_38113/g.74480 Transcript_38113/m.74480 type:complete len:247 (+) Transcript_38113:107-847(+)